MHQRASGESLIKIGYIETLFLRTLSSWSTVCVDFHEERPSYKYKLTKHWTKTHTICLKIVLEKCCCNVLQKSQRSRRQGHCLTRSTRV